MMKNLTTTLFVMLTAVVLLAQSACDMFGEKTDTDFIDVPTYDSAAVAFVPILPAWEGFMAPTDIVTGFDETFYIVDNGTEEVIQYDAAGRELGRLNVPGAKRVVQDRRLDLLVIGSHDTLIAGQEQSLASVYRVDLYSTGIANLTNASVERIVTHPFYFKTSFVAADGEVVFNDIDVLADNRYYLTRQGPNASASRIGGSDDAILRFSKDDVWEDFIRVNTAQGNITDFFNEPYGITTFAKPPQGVFVDASESFLVTVRGENEALQALAIGAGPGPDGIEYRLSTNLILGDTSQADGFLYDAFRFGAPAGPTIDRNGELLYIPDTEKDSLFVFTTDGLEGVNPPPGSSSTKNINVSFGGTGSGPLEFNQPVEVCRDRDIVYVVDRGNRRISRFQLTTDF